ncbi:phospholipid-binding protein MlaC [uncultured Acinetobacter sp.]|uniref:MlaC/ttg2D family ABC transporter substrate-binding protein n=1 Tax=uncultured Acinetobacter sp. TaxID=165433 RepID=UPI0026318B35|nr:ABC transporter substrate-binding protein [uncultured Acinetobacter sp.]
MKTLMKQTLSASVLATLLAGTAFAAPTQTPPDFIRQVADTLIKRVQADQGKLQNNPALVKTIVRQHLDPHIDSQAFVRTVMGTYVQQSSAAQRAQFEKNFRETLIENYGSAFAKYSNQTYTMRPYKAAPNVKNPVVTIDFNNKGQKIPVAFQLVERGNKWKIRNINVSGIDLGLQFRNQFAANVKRNGNNLDKAIATFKPDADSAVKK